MSSAIFRDIALALMDWRDPPEPTLHREIAAYLATQPRQPIIYRPFCKQDSAEPYDLNLDQASYDNHRI